jgi:broad specificity phosphatase PhoE
MRLVLIRHGQTAWNVAGRAQGHTDIGLDPTGLAQVSTFAELFSGVRVSEILSSDLLRCRETVAPIALATGMDVQFTERLRERKFGDWEGSPYMSVAPRMAEIAESLGQDLTEVRPPNGESFADVWTRLSLVVDELRQADGTVVVVSHGGALAVLLAILGGGSVATSRMFRLANASICELERRDDGTFYLERYNDTTHLTRSHVGSPV